MQYEINEVTTMKDQLKLNKAMDNHFTLHTGTIIDRMVDSSQLN